MIKVLYVHGYNGHANGNSSKLIKSKLENLGVECTVDAPDIPILNPEEAKSLIKNIGKNYDVIIASSMGAFYSMMQFGTIKILINPALPDTLRGLDSQDFSIEFMQKVDKLKADFFDKYQDIESMDETYFFFGDKDSIAKNKDFFTSNYIESQIFVVKDMEHQLNEDGANEIAKFIKNQLVK